MNQLEVSRVFPDEVDLIYAQGGDSVALMQTARQVEQVNVGFQRIRRQVERIRQLRTKLSQEHRLSCSPWPEDGDEGPPFALGKPLPHEAALVQLPHLLDRPRIQLEEPIDIHVVRLVLKVSLRQTICRNVMHFVQWMAEMFLHSQHGALGTGAAPAADRRRGNESWAAAPVRMGRPGGCAPWTR